MLCILFIGHSQHAADMSPLTIVCCYFDSTSLSYCINIIVVPCLQLTTPTFDCRYLHCLLGTVL